MEVDLNERFAALVSDANAELQAILAAREVERRERCAEAEAEVKEHKRQLSRNVARAAGWAKKEAVNEAGSLPPKEAAELLERLIGEAYTANVSPKSPQMRSAAARASHFITAVSNPLKLRKHKTGHDELVVDPAGLNHICDPPVDDNTGV